MPSWPLLASAGQGEGFRVGVPEPSGLRSEGATLLTDCDILSAHLCGSGGGDRQQAGLVLSSGQKGSFVCAVV